MRKGIVYFINKYNKYSTYSVSSVSDMKSNSATCELIFSESISVSMNTLYYIYY